MQKPGVRFKAYPSQWKALSRPFALALLWAPFPLHAQSTYSLNVLPPQGAILYQPYIGSRIYSAILEQTILGGRRGLSFYGVISSSERSGPSTFAVTAALPFTKAEDPRSAGWALGAGYGQTTFSYEPDRYLAPPLKFFELMLGRTSTEAKAPAADGSVVASSGFGGYLEITLRGEQPIANAEFESITGFYAMSVPKHNRSINLRIGAVSGLGGAGYVAQKAPARFGYSYHLGLTMPFLDQQATLIHLQNKLFFYCRKPNWICGTDIAVHHARNTSKNDAFEDLKNQLFYGAWMQWYLSDRYLLSGAVTWVFSMNGQQKLASGVPLARTSFSIAF